MIFSLSSFTAHTHTRTHICMCTRTYTHTHTYIHLSISSSSASWLLSVRLFRQCPVLCFVYSRLLSLLAAAGAHTSSAQPVTVSNRGTGRRGRRSKRERDSEEAPDNDRSRFSLFALPLLFSHSLVTHTHTHAHTQTHICTHSLPLYLLLIAHLSGLPSDVALLSVSRPSSSLSLFLFLLPPFFSTICPPKPIPHPLLNTLA